MSTGISPIDDGLGLALSSVADGVAELRLDPTSLALFDHEGTQFLHGGALATCMDTAAWYAADSASPGSWLVSSLAIDCLRPALAAPHHVRATCRKAGRTLARVDVEIAATDTERVVALGRVTLARSGV